MRPLRVCIDARLIGGTDGGVEQVIIGLATGLSNLSDGDEEYWFLVHPDAKDWIRPYIDGPCRLLYSQSQSRKSDLKRRFESVFSMLRCSTHQLPSPFRNWMTDIARIPMPEKALKSAQIDVMHFPKQKAFLTDIPSIFHPHDLQHLHFPQFFTAYTRYYREVTYRAYCSQAQMVAVASSWTKDDLIRHYRLPAEKVSVIPLAPLLNAYPESSEEAKRAVKEKYSLPDVFGFFPAQTWPHKNHMGLLETLAILRDKYGVCVPFVFSGRMNDFYRKIEAGVRELRLDHQVQSLGFVDPQELNCLYKLCRCVVIPTRFEAGSFPVWEAFVAGAPVACSRVTSLPQQAGNAAILFDPDDPDDIALAIHRLWTDDALREELVLRGKERIRSFSWNKTARTFRAHYRRIAQRSLSQEDKTLLTAAPQL